MEKKTNLDDYLAGLGISDTEDATPIAVQNTATPPPPVTPEEIDPAILLERFLKGFVERVDSQLKVKVHTTEDGLQCDISGQGAIKLAGRDGRNLTAIEVLCYTVLAKEANRADLRVHVDAANWRKRHEDRLKQLAEKIAMQVQKTGEVFQMDPIPAADRRIIHMTLKELPGIETYSEGEGKERHIIVKPL